MAVLLGSAIWLGVSMGRERGAKLEQMPTSTKLVSKCSGSPGTREATGVIKLNQRIDLGNFSAHGCTKELSHRRLSRRVYPINAINRRWQREYLLSCSAGILTRVISADLQQAYQALGLTRVSGERAPCYETRINRALRAPPLRAEEMAADGPMPLGIRNALGDVSTVIRRTQKMMQEVESA